VHPADLPGWGAALQPLGSARGDGAEIWEPFAPRMLDSSQATTDRQQPQGEQASAERWRLRFPAGAGR